MAVNRRRLAAVLVMALQLLSLGGTALHQALVHHVRCAEHGELVHATTPTTRDALLSLAAFDQSHVALSAAAHGDDHAHDHCTLGALNAAVGIAAPCTHVLPRPAAVFVVSAPAASAVAEFVVVERYRLAPKTSPPAAALPFV